MNITRKQLHEELPLDTPYSLHVFPAHYCNFRCSYCLHSMTADELDKLSFRRQFISIDNYRRAIDGMKDFKRRLKALIFAGHGEPLLHREIDTMVKYAKDMDIAERVEIVTNASLLTPELSDRLILAGLDRLRISIQGVTAEKYGEISGIDIDYGKFVGNIGYFYRQRKQAEVYIKIIDIALDNKDEEKLFYDLFSGISDTAAIEYAIPFVPGMDHSGLRTDFTRCKQGHKQTSVICSMPFYMLVLAPDGDILPCCNTEVPLTYGNVSDASLSDIWSSELRRRFLRMQLTDRGENPVCRRCNVPSYGLQEGDYLDAHAERLFKLFE